MRFEKIPVRSTVTTRAIVVSILTNPRYLTTHIKENTFLLSILGIVTGIIANFALSYGNFIGTYPAATQAPSR